MFDKAMVWMAAATATFAFAPAAQAEIIKKDEAGFVVRHTVEVKASPLDVYKTLRAPARWWSPDHSWTGDAKNFYMDAQAGGCFCELIAPVKEGEDRGSVEHMRIVFAQPGKLLRLSGGLGPLQSEAVNGTLTIAIKATPKGTTIVGFEYIVGGYMRYDMDTISSAVDGVVGEQILRLSKLLGPIDSAESLPANDEADEASADEDAEVEAVEEAERVEGEPIEEEDAAEEPEEKSKFDEEFGDYTPSAPENSSASDEDESS